MCSSPLLRARLIAVTDVEAILTCLIYMGLERPTHCYINNTSMHLSQTTAFNRDSRRHGNVRLQRLLNGVSHLMSRRLVNLARNMCIMSMHSSVLKHHYRGAGVHQNKFLDAQIMNDF